MAEITLDQIMKKYNVGLLRLIKFLNENAVITTVDPNYTISDVYMPILEKKFGSDSMAITDRDIIKARLHAIIEMGTKQRNLSCTDDVALSPILHGYKEVGPTILGATRVLTDDDKILFINEKKELINITQAEFDEIWEETIREAELKIQSARSKLKRRIYTIHFTEWNGIHKIYRTMASSILEAEENFWSSGVKAGTFINSID